MAIDRSAGVEVVVPHHTFDPTHSIDHLPAEEPKSPNDLIRAASFTSLAGLSKEAHHSTGGLKRTFSDNVLTSHIQSPTKVSHSMQNANAELFRRASKKTKKRMSMSMSTFGVVAEDKAGDGSRNDRAEVEQSRSIRSVSGTIKSLARRSWMPTARTASPLRENGLSVGRRRSNSPTKNQVPFVGKPIAVPEPVVTRSVSRLSPQPEESRVEPSTPKPRRQVPSPAPPMSRSLKDVSSRNSSVTSFPALSRQSSSTSLKSRSSNEGMYLDIPRGKMPPLPTSTSSDRLSGLSLDNGRKKDPLWTVFRVIEGEYSTFQSKTSLQKAKAIRGVLLPFLSKHAEHPSNHSLRAEDLDRRVHILNKWWSGLLEVLNGRSNQSISGTDRPAFLEATTEIMLRPEWRVPPFRKILNESASHRSGTSSNKWTPSIDSDDSDFLLDSIHQNIRNIFVQNLLSQMAFVVDKLSMRSAPASLVNFGGKTCAYAFFFCPGVADVLVRLWHLPAGMLRRIFSEYGTLHTGKGICTPADLALKFPPPVRSLCFRSQSALSRHLQPKAVRPPGSENIRWYGPWVNRWIGRDSDLFFVFTKYYHLLVCDFHPTTLTQEERVCIPGLVPVHAQMLVALEASLYRHVGHFTTDPYTPADNIDAMAPMPMTIPNATRSVAENRLVMLLRDLVSDSSPVHQSVSELLVGSFDLLLKAATRKTSMYNSDACFVLCDFVEELCPILGRYQQHHARTAVFDWEFWLGVLKQMMQAHTTMTQIRVIALLYSMWNILASTEERKRKLVLEWILDPAFFDTFFNHWSSMVRHYFYRLLCWRVARCDGEASELDMKILQTLANHLNRSWAHHQYLVADADMRNLCPPSSSPCSPAPSRMLVIIRTDSQPLSPQFSTFDKILSQNQSFPYRNNSTPLSPVVEADSPQNNGNNKKRWSILRNMNPFASTPGNSRPGEVTPPASPEGSLNGRRGTDSAPGSRPVSRPATPPHQTLSFKFSLEYSSNRPTLPAKPRKLPPPVLPTNPQKLLDDLSTMERLSSESQSAQGIKPKKPSTEDAGTARYSGRALAEWAQVVAECRNFYKRRKLEGCPKDSLVETPTMAVESFRMFG